MSAPSPVIFIFCADSSSKCSKQHWQNSQKSFLHLICQETWYLFNRLCWPLCMMDLTVKEFKSQHILQQNQRHFIKFRRLYRSIYLKRHYWIANYLCWWCFKYLCSTLKSYRTTCHRRTGDTLSAIKQWYQNDDVMNTSFMVTNSSEWQSNQQNSY